MSIKAERIKENLTLSAILSPVIVFIWVQVLIYGGGQRKWDPASGDGSILGVSS
jgi:hypothetical protein